MRARVGGVPADALHARRQALWRAVAQHLVELKLTLRRALLNHHLTLKHAVPRGAQRVLLI